MKTKVEKVLAVGVRNLRELVEGARAGISTARPKRKKVRRSGRKSQRSDS